MVDLSGSFELESEILDRDHHRLADLVNEIVARIDAGETDDLVQRVRDFVALAKGHFGREERHLMRLGYPDLAKHQAHHRSLDQKMAHMIEFAGVAAENELARESLKKELVFFLMDDVITTDLDFKPYLNDAEE